MDNNDPEALKLKAEIEEAFADVPYPGDDNIANSGIFEDAEVTGHFKGIKWQDYKDNPSQFLNGRLSGDSFFLTNEAFHYYLPLYMIQGLIDDNNSQCLADEIITSFDASTSPEIRKHVAGRLSSITVKQLKVILVYLKFVIERIRKALPGYSNDSIGEAMKSVDNELRNRQDK
ncbi:MAG: hypothetical protein COT17_08520 [Elusimicrobia bacterium CG08_land_8_20_14_0_20_51_18]|nr:MAG: hypothetical protein COT17_08520 [Elusimicrobia bacterium CG08_land_8_20_14_0_20_51_18]